MTFLEQLESVTCEEVIEWVNKKNASLDLNALQKAGVQVPTAQDLWEERNKAIKALRSNR